jgi:hypothetical protein
MPFPNALRTSRSTVLTGADAVLGVPFGVG